VSTPVGDWIRKTWPDNPGATHYLGPGDDPGCCAGGHARCTYEAGWREALLSLAAELDREAAETSTEADAHAARGDDDAGCMASGASDAWRAAAAMARLRAQVSSSEASEADLVSGEGLELTGGLSPAQAYMAGVKAERERCTLLLDRKRAVFCRPCDGEVCDYSGELAPASELVRGGGDG
jgi:hypothetical protein